MRKTLILILLLTLLSAGTMTYAVLDLYPLRDQVSVRELSTEDYGLESIGNTSILKGLTATLKTDYYEAMCWETSVHFGDVLPETETEYSLQFPLKKTTNYTRTGSRIELRTIASNVLDGTDIMKELEGMAKGLAPGEERTKLIHLKDYADYYNVQATFVFPHGTFSWREEAPSTIENDTEAALKKLVDENFLFPLEDSANVIAQVENNVKYGPSYGYSMNHTSEGYSLEVIDTFCGDSAWFGFSHTTEGGWIPDLTQLPLGYGIYRLTIPEDGSQPSLINVCPLETGTTVLKLTVEAGGERVLAHTVENGKYTVTVISVADNTAVQRLELADFPSNSEAWATYEAEGCTAVTLSHKIETRQLILLTCNESGLYQIHWNQTLPSEESTMLSYSDNSFRDYYYDHSPSIAWNGRYLAFGLSEDYRTQFELALYDETGLVYNGYYRTSLNHWPVEPDKATPLTLAWE